MKKLILLSTGVALVNEIVEKVKAFNKEIEIYNIVDDSIIKTIAKNNGIIPDYIFDRIKNYCFIADEMNADALLLTCSSISETIDYAREKGVRTPLFKIDEPMIDFAVKNSNKSIGVIATVKTTLQPTLRLIQNKLIVHNKKIRIESILCEDAFDAYLKNDTVTHNRLVKEGINKLLQECEYVILAQASMARVLSEIDHLHKLKILNSPDTGIKPVIEFLS